METTQPVQQPFTRKQAYQILTKHLKNPNLIKHCLATEATMKALYQKLNPPPYDPLEEEKWSLTGLLHDADYELCKGKPEIHGLLLFEKEKTIPADIAYAIKSHNYQMTQVVPTSPMDWAITCCDQLTGLIIAATLVSPDKKLEKIYPEFIMNRFKQASFARGADRATIQLCEEKLGIPLTDFVQLTLTAMQGIHKELGL